MVARLGAAVLLLALAVPTSAAGPVAPTSLPVIEEMLYLTGETMRSVDGDPSKALARSPSPDQAYSTYVLPGADILGILPDPIGLQSERWENPIARAKDTVIVSDATAELYFAANLQALAVFSVRLYDVAPDGRTALIHEESHQFLTALSPEAVRFPLATAGVVILKDHLLRLEVRAQTSDVAVIFLYGGDTPSAILDLHTSWLDTDADGMPDSDERAVNRNPYFPNDAPGSADGDRDGLPDDTERALGTDPNKRDTDGDGYVDGLEVFAGSNPLDAESIPYDLNENGLPDSYEEYHFNTTVIQGPCTPGPGCVDPTADPDGDGCDNLCEAVNGTNPNNPDTDRDGISDGDEIQSGGNPLGPNAAKSWLSTAVEPVVGAGLFAIGTTLALAGLLRRN